MKKKLKFRSYKDSSAYDYDSCDDDRQEDMQKDVNSGCAVVSKLHAVSGSAPSLNWLAAMLLALLLVFPFVVQYLPQGVRQYLSATVR